MLMNINLNLLDGAPSSPYYSAGIMGVDLPISIGVIVIDPPTDVLIWWDIVSLRFSIGSPKPILLIGLFVVYTTPIWPSLFIRDVLPLNLS